MTEVVVGLPLSLSGEAGSQAERANDFAGELGLRFQVTVHMYDERLSTQEALHSVSDDHRGERRGRQKGPAADTDALAASIILQAFLDRQRFSEFRADD